MLKSKAGIDFRKFTREYVTKGIECFNEIPKLRRGYRI